MDVLEVTDPVQLKLVSDNERNSKRKREDDGLTASPKHPLLESVCNRYQLNQANRQNKMMEHAAKQDAQQAHSAYIKKNIADPRELKKANQTVKYWANKNGVKDAPILGSRSAQLLLSPTASSLNNQSKQRSVISKNSTNSPSANRKPKKKQKNNDAKEKNTGSTSDSSPNQSIEMVDSDNSDQDTAAQPPSPDHVINLLDESADDSYDCIEILDVSNNSNSHGINSPSEHKQRKNTRKTSKYVCAILNCEAVFTSEGALGHHKNLFKHSPCNPLLKVVDCKLSPDPQFFMCPECDQEFQTVDSCRNHMKMYGHMSFLPPLLVSCFMCAQCLYVFNNYQSCWQHIEDSLHQDFCYPFKDDQEPSIGGGGIGPVPVAEDLLQDLLKKCDKVPYRVQCLECTMDMENPAVLRHHMLETNNQHVVSALSETNLVDIFAGYLAGYSCDTCHRLFNGGMKELAKHQCADGVIGTIIENDTRSFSEFVKRCALSLVKSEETSKAKSAECRPGPSHAGTGASPKRRNQKISVIEISDSPLRDTDNELDLTKGLSETVAISNNSDNERNTHSDKQKSSPTKSPVKKSAKSSPNCDPSQNKETFHPDNLALTTESKRKKTKFEEKEVIPVNKPEDDKSKGFLGLSLQIETSGSQSGDTRKRSKSPVFPTANLQTHMSGIHGNQRGQLQLPPRNIGEKNFYCHPPPPSLQPSVNIPRYPLRNQNRNDTSTSITRTFQSNSITMGEQRPGPTSAQDFQVAGPSHQTNKVTAMDQSSNGPSLKRDRSRSPVIGAESVVAIENLMTLKNIIFLDLDNWPSFFIKMPRVLPEGTLVWGFFGGKNIWREPFRCFVFKQMKLKRQFYLNERCGFTKDAADFAIVLTVGKMDALLPTSVAFTILSGDKGFCEVERQMKTSKRKAVVINPYAAESSNEMIYTMVTSVTDT